VRLKSVCSPGKNSYWMESELYKTRIKKVAVCVMMN
jgi:hypothetical protein